MECAAGRGLIWGKRKNGQYLKGTMNKSDATKGRGGKMKREFCVFRTHVRKPN